MARPLPLLFLAAMALAGDAGTAAGEPAMISATDLFNVRQIETPALSPDGLRVAYIVRSVEAKSGAMGGWFNRSELWLADLDGKTPPHRLTTDTADETAPVWSPGGDRLAFVRCQGQEPPQIYVLAPSGGDAQPLTHLETGATDPHWSPDGRQILFSSTLSFAAVRAGLEKAGRPAAPPWGAEKPGRPPNDTANWAYRQGKDSPAGDETRPVAKPDGTRPEIREWLARTEAAVAPRAFNRPNFPAATNRAGEAAFTQLYTVDAAPGATPRAITLDYENHEAAAWLRDGKTVVCLGPRQPAASPDRLGRTNCLVAIDVATSDRRVLLDGAGECYASPVPSPDGRWIAYTVTTGGEFTFDQAMVAVIPVAGGAPRLLTPRLDRNAANLKWSPDSRFVYFTAPDRGRIPLDRAAVDLAEPQKLTVATDWGVQDYDVASGNLVQVVTEPRDPWELYAGPADGQGARAVTTHNSAWLGQRKLSAYEPHRLENSEGITVDYWTLKPANFDPGHKYPLLLEIHGGPAEMWGPGEPSRWFELQFFAARGYAIVFANPRGSGGYGRDFMHANFRDWGIGPASDVLNAAGFASNETFIDRQRQVVTGVSYGGYLTAWIVGHDHRFKAAAAQRGIYDLATFYGEDRARFLLPWYWGGYPWQPEVRALLERDSPLTSVTNISTPLVINPDELDCRNGPGQSQLLYQSLKQLGQEVEYVRYPHSTHERPDSGNPAERLDRLVRLDEFFRRFIGEN